MEETIVLNLPHWLSQKLTTSPVHRFKAISAWAHCCTRANRLVGCLGLRMGGLEVAVRISRGARACDRCCSHEASRVSGVLQRRRKQLWGRWKRHVTRATTLCSLVTKLTKDKQGAISIIAAINFHSTFSQAQPQEDGQAFLARGRMQVQGSTCSTSFPAR
jgi:hypothetical protein